MRMYDIIKKKRDGGELSVSEINFFVKGYTKGDIPDEQASALLMAIYFQGMNITEISALTLAIVNSGDKVDLSKIEGIKVDKHSTGGVGDKTSLIIAPIVASCGVKVAKMSGRGLGHTGGTIDKLESIEGYQTSISQEKFFDIVNKVGVSIIGQSGELAPADKKLYALRDVTATVDKLPLIAASIMGKKLASGSDRILLDVKFGSGSFNHTYKDAKNLARVMVDIGKATGKKTMALITNMDIPLGRSIGNALEVKECIQTLKGEGAKDLTELCIILAGHMLYLADKGDIGECMEMAENSIKNGNAFQTFLDMVKAHGGNENYILNPCNFPIAPIVYEIKADTGGYISRMDTEKYGIASQILGAGRNTKEDKIDYSAGILVNKKTGEYVHCGETIAILHTSKKDAVLEAEEIIKSALIFSDRKPRKEKMVLGKVE